MKTYQEQLIQKQKELIKYLEESIEMFSGYPLCTEWYINRKNEINMIERLKGKKHPIL
jgi:hypothetical protein